MRARPARCGMRAEGRMRRRAGRERADSARVDAARRARESEVS
ncbi:hypothetical protein BURMUCGD1_4332 [Burkholderia multivorans CGD1]|nr:hypothetical protein BURMUCGD1_4332 [Burkholderia multivorans CGD1]